MLGEDMMEPLVVNFHVKERLEGQTGAVEVCVGSARHIGQLLTGIELLPIAHTSLTRLYSFPETESTDVVTLPGIMYKLPYAIATDSLGANASIGRVQMT